jgi:hypothetical protein
MRGVLDHRRSPVCIKLLGFAIAEGGTIFLGVADDGTTPGLSAHDAARLNQLVGNTANHAVRSPLTVQTKNVALPSGRVVIVLTVPKGLDKPCFDKNSVIWLKAGADKRRVNSKGELLVNALVHRDYLISAPIRLFVFDNRIEIISPGTLPNNLSVENIRAGNSNLRNPILASFVAKGVLPYRGLGSGVPRALEAWPDIDFRDDRDGGLFVATVRRKVGSADLHGDLAGQVTGQVTGQVAKLVGIVDGEMTRQALQVAVGVTSRSHFRAAFLDLALVAGLIEMTQPDKRNSRSQRYRLTPAGKELQRRRGTTRCRLPAPIEFSLGSVLRAYPKLPGVGHDDPNTIGWSDIKVPPFCMATEEIELTDGALVGDGIAVANARGLRLEGQVEEIRGVGGIPDGTRAVSMFLVNRPAPDGQGFRDRAYAFQVELELRCAEGFFGRPDWSGKARHRVTVAGYSFDGGAGIFETLHQAMNERNVAVRFFLDIEQLCERLEQKLRADKQRRARLDPLRQAKAAGPEQYAREVLSLFRELYWPYEGKTPDLFHDPRTADRRVFASLHAKCLIVDDERVLITSANFTGRGQERNIEVGALIHDRGYAGALEHQWNNLVESGDVVRG